MNSFSNAAIRLIACSLAAGAACAETRRPVEAAPLEQVPEQAPPTLYIREIRVLGTKELPKIDVEETVYPFLGPGRTFEDVKDAAAALTKAYQDKGYKAAQVIIPEQDGRGGVVNLQVYEGKVGALKITGAKYFLPSRIRAQAQSLAPGSVINFNHISPEIVKLNKLADRRVEPKLTPSLEPGFFDIELQVKDTSPLHGSAELNNRASLNTTDLRLNVSLSYANLWQRGHTIGASYQVSPQNLDEIRVLNGFYIWREPEWESFSLMFTGSKQHSHTISPAALASASGEGGVLAPGFTLGVRAMFELPSAEGFFQSMSLGLDYKAFDSNNLAGGAFAIGDVRYYPISATWDGTWLHSQKEDGKSKETGSTSLNVGLTFGPRGLGSDEAAFNNSRAGSDGSFAYLRGSLEHEHKLARDWELVARVQGQATDSPLIAYEQFSAGGMSTVRGYYESEALGDNALLGTLELRSPSLLKTKKLVGEGDAAKEESSGNEWRFYGFMDGGSVTLQKALPEQISSYRIASVGLGSELHLWDHLHGILELALPLTSIPYTPTPGVQSTNTKAHETRVNFRLWSDF